MVLVNVAAPVALAQCGGILAAQVRRIVEHLAYDATAGLTVVSRTPLPSAGLHLPCSAAGVAESTTLPTRCRRRESDLDRQRCVV